MDVSFPERIGLLFRRMTLLRIESRNFSVGAYVTPTRSGILQTVITPINLMKVVRMFHRKGHV